MREKILTTHSFLASLPRCFSLPPRQEPVKKGRAALKQEKFLWSEEIFVIPPSMPPSLAPFWPVSFRLFSQ